jgi:hypothetical protein
MLADCAEHFRTCGTSAVETGEAQAVERLGICGDALRGEDHLGRVDGVQRCDLGDDGVVTAAAVFG